MSHYLIFQFIILKEAFVFAFLSLLVGILTGAHCKQFQTVFTRRLDFFGQFNCILVVILWRLIGMSQRIYEYAVIIRSTRISQIVTYIQSSRSHDTWLR